MTIQDYLIDHTNFDWRNLLYGWTTLLRPKFTVWLVNRFGDLFFVSEDGTVHMLDISGDDAAKVAENRLFLVAITRWRTPASCRLSSATSFVAQFTGSCAISLMAYRS